jgi:hypothetical protein
VTAPDPRAGDWPAYAASLRGEINAEIARAFDWIARELAAGGTRGGVAILIAAADLEDGMPLQHVIAGLLDAAARQLPGEIPHAYPAVPAVPGAYPGGAR